MIPDSPLVLLDRLTPVQCRAIARRMDRRGQPLRVSDIAKASGLTIGQVSWISRQKSWDGITVGDASRFMLACGVTLRNHHRHLAYIRTTAKASWPMAHLHKLPWKSRKTILTCLT